MTDAKNRLLLAVILEPEIPVVAKITSGRVEVTFKPPAAHPRISRNDRDS
jgi:hypothetical protein